MTKHIASVSGGKDSVATLIVAKEHGEPLDEVVYSEVMFDKETSGEMPEHIDFINNRLKPFVEDVLRVPFVHLKSEITYVDFFTHIVSRGANNGMIAGFPIPGMCAINRDCKIPPIRNYWEQNGEDVVQYVGIEFDEQERIMRLQGTNRISLLEKYKVSKNGAVDLCVRYDLYSPCYSFSKRNGCWFCMNCKDREWAHLIFNHEELFDKLIRLENEFPQRARRNISWSETPSEIKKRILQKGYQMRFF